MSTKYRIITAAFLFALSVTTQAFAVTPVKVKKKTTTEDTLEKIYQSYLDSLTVLRERFDRWNYNGGDTLSNPYYYSLFSSPTFYSSSIHRVLGPLGNRTPVYNSTDSLLLEISDVLNHVYTHSPWLILHDEKDLGEGTLREDGKTVELKPEADLTKKTGTAMPDRSEDDDLAGWDIVVRKPNFWSFSTKLQLDLMQTHVSDNWYRGGESNYSWKSQLTFKANYNNKQKVIWENTLEMKLGFRSSSDDEKHKFLSNTDLLRLTNKLGIRATKYWYYTLSWKNWTQFYPGYRKNDDRVYSDFMSPFESLVSLGMDFKYNKKNFNVSATLSPLAYDLKYVDRKRLATSFGVDAGKHSKSSFGSEITVIHDLTLMKNVTWHSRLFYYTNYERVLVEWENTFNMTINKYLKTKLFLFPRFDDSVKRKEGESLLQFNEELTFGLEFNF